MRAANQFSDSIKIENSVKSKLQSANFRSARALIAVSGFALSGEKLHNDFYSARAAGFMKFAAELRILLIAAWLGAAIFFSVAVAQSAFAVLPSREIAGALVNRTLAILNYAGFSVGLILLASSFISKERVNLFRLRLEQGLLLLLTAACAFGQFVIGAKLHALREQIGRPIDELASDDVLRLAFNALHGYSVTVLSVAMLAGLAAFFLIARRAGKIENQEK